MKNKHQIIKPNFGLPFYIMVHTNATPEYVPLHWHRSIEVNCMLDWPLSQIYVNGQKYDMMTGRIWCANSMEPHYVRPLKNDINRKAISLILPFDFVKSIYPQIDQGRIILNDIDKMSQLQKKIYKTKLFSDFDELYEITKQSDNLQRINLYICTLKVMKLIFRYFFNNEEIKLSINNEHAQRMILIRDYVSNNYRSRIRLEDLVPIVNLSRSQLAKDIKNSFNMTLNEYVNLVRSEKVLKDIQSGITNQTLLASKNGFSGLRSMNRWLVKFYSVNAKGLFKSAD